MIGVEFFKNVVRSNSGYSSKRLAALVLLGSGIIIPTICLFLNPIGEISESVLILTCQLLATGCGLLGFTLKETVYTRPGTPKVPTEVPTPTPTPSPSPEVPADNSSSNRCTCNCHNKSSNKKDMYGEEYDDRLG